ncbi:MAG: SpoIIIAH-like family protein [Christensenellaceae bacterium]|nr:SpoIIIAH-like family protein [Christensenellaceae bacterium]
MRETGDFMTRHRNLLLILLLLVTMVVSSLANQERIAQEAATVSLPVVEPYSEPAGKIELFRQQRDAASLQDMAALQTLVDQEQLDQQTRAEAAAQLRALVDTREKQLALEGALLESGLSPCVAVISAGQVTIVTEKTVLTDDETALLMTMAQLHAGALPAQVSVITTD